MQKHKNEEKKGNSHENTEKESVCIKKKRYACEYAENRVSFRADIQKGMNHRYGPLRKEMFREHSHFLLCFFKIL